MKPIDQPYGLCSVDPATLVTGLVTGLASGAIGGLFGGGKPTETPAATPPEAPSAPPPTQSPVGQRSGGASATQPSFVGSSTVPSPQSFGQKTLLGQ